MKKLRAHRAARIIVAVIVREGGRSSIPETFMIESISRGVLDAPPSRSMTASLSPPSFRDGPKDQTRNLEIRGSMLRIAPE
jgi:hypothetical protein